LATSLDDIRGILTKRAYGTTGDKKTCLIGYRCFGVAFGHACIAFRCVTRDCDAAGDEGGEEDGGVGEELHGCFSCGSNL